MIYLQFFLLVSLLRSFCASQEVKDGLGGDVMSETKNQSCLSSATISNTLVLDKSGSGQLECDCYQNNNSVIVWLDENCMKISNSEFYITEGGSLRVSVAEKGRDSWKIHCTNGRNCSASFTLAPEKGEQLTVESLTARDAVPGLSSGLIAFLIILIVLLVLLATFFIYKKCKNQIYLGCRDICTPSSDRDGKEFDAYVSIGKNTNDLKFVERNIVDILQRKYGYKFYVDEDNLLPQLDYSEKVQSKLHKCRRLIVVFTPAYMSHDWCNYCFSEGLRKLLELNTRMIFIISDPSIERDINSLSTIVGHVPKLYISFLPVIKSKREKETIVQKLRLLLPPCQRSLSVGRGIRTPMLSEVEDMDERSIKSEASKEVKYSALENDSTNQEEEEGDRNEEAEFDDVDPNAIKVHNYKAKKDFYSFTTVPVEDDI